MNESNTIGQRVIVRATKVTVTQRTNQQLLFRFEKLQKVIIVRPGLHGIGLPAFILHHIKHRPKLGATETRLKMTNAQQAA